MKAPDKIYLEKDKEIDKIHYLWGRLPVIHSGYEHIEYIRKDAILKWVKEQESCLTVSSVSSDAFQLALDMLKEKLNKL